MEKLNLSLRDGQRKKNSNWRQYGLFHSFGKDPSIIV